MATFTVPCPKAASTSLGRVGLAAQSLHQFQQQRRLSLQHGENASSNASLCFGFQCCKAKQSAVWKVQAQLSKVTAGNSNSVAVPSAKSGVALSEGKDEPPEEIIEHNNVPDPASISAFMTQVSDLVKLVDSRDIVELQLKQLDCELIIRKKEAVQQPTLQVPAATIPYPSPLPPQAPAATATPAIHPPSAPAPVSPAPAKTSTPSHPPLKCPMAGTFYRSPGPGEPPFVKVGDKVQKGQVICIIEAMKLMNEIEADQSGTIAEIIAEDGKPVSVDTSLFVIVP